MTQCKKYTKQKERVLINLTAVIDEFASAKGQVDGRSPAENRNWAGNENGKETRRRATDPFHVSFCFVF